MSKNYFYLYFTFTINIVYQQYHQIEYGSNHNQQYRLVAGAIGKPL